MAEFELHVRVLEVRGLQAPMPHPTPYLALQLASAQQGEPIRSGFLSGANPQFNFKTKAGPVRDPVQDSLLVTVLHYMGSPTTDTRLGTAVIPFREAVNGAVVDRCYPLYLDGRPVGDVHVRIQLMLSGERELPPTLIAQLQQQVAYSAGPMNQQQIPPKQAAPLALPPPAQGPYSPGGPAQGGYMPNPQPGMYPPTAQGGYPGAMQAPASGPGSYPPAPSPYGPPGAPMSSAQAPSAFYQPSSQPMMPSQQGGYTPMPSQQAINPYAGGPYAGAAYQPVPVTSAYGGMPMGGPAPMPMPMAVSMGGPAPAPMPMPMSMTMPMSAAPMMMMASPPVGNTVVYETRSYGW